MTLTREENRLAPTTDTKLKESAAPADPKIALVSVGMGRIQRGFEKYFRDLFELLQDDLQVTLLKGRGNSSSRERTPSLYGPLRAACALVPLGNFVGRDYNEYKRDCVAYGFSLLPSLLRKEFDLLHIIDPPLAATLSRLKRRFHLPFRMVFTEGTLMPVPFYPQGAHIHLVAESALTEAIGMGADEKNLTLIPVGVNTAKFLDVPSREQLRQEYGVKESTFVVLAVTAIRRIHKRVHHVINEVSQLEGDVLLWVDGNEEDPFLMDYAKKKLGSRCRITHIPSQDIPKLHRLADVFVHAAVEESYGLATVEALCTGLPVLAHDSPHFQWIVRDRESVVDMRLPGMLAARLREIWSYREEFLKRAQTKAIAMRERYDWHSLKQAYIDMYKKVAAAPESA